MSFRVLLIGGGSGGHAYPLIAVAQALEKKAQNLGTELEVLMLGDDRFLKNAAQENNIRFKHIYTGKLRRYFSPLILLDLIKFPVGFLQSLWYLLWFMPDAVFSKGGYDSVPPALVAKLYFIPLYIHESDSVPGMANSFFGHFAKRIFIAFSAAAQQFKKPNVDLVGNPVRLELLKGDRQAGYAFFKFNPDRKTVLILGGSQGAKQINNIIIDSLVALTNAYQVIHQCGESQYLQVKAELDRILKEGEGKYAQNIQNNYRLYPFLGQSELAQAYAVGDLVVSRAGASSIFEIAAIGKPVIIIPLESAAGNHQMLNAVEFSKHGAVIIEGSNITSHILINQIQSLFEPDHYTKATEQVKTFATPDAADKIAEVILAHL